MAIIDSWIAVAAAFIFNGIMIAFLYGKLTQTVTDHDRRINVLEKCVFSRRATDER